MSEQDRSGLSQDLIFDILSNKRRRYILLYLSRYEGGATVQELSEQIAIWENETTLEELSDKQRKRVYVSLYQTHIPKLEEAGIIDYDEESGLITLTGEAKSVTAYLEGENETTEPWPYLYFLLVAIGTLTFTATAMDFSIFSALPDFAIGIGIIIAFGVLTIFYVLSRQQSSAGDTFSLKLPPRE